MFFLLSEVAASTGDMTVLEFIKTLTGLTGAGVMALFIWLWLTGKIITRRELDAEKEEKSEWKEMALGLIDMNKRATGTAERAVTATEKLAVDVATNTRSSP